MRWKDPTPVEEEQDPPAVPLPPDPAAPPEVSRRTMTTPRIHPVKDRTPSVPALATTPQRKAG